MKNKIVGISLGVLLLVFAGNALAIAPAAYGTPKVYEIEFLEFYLTQSGSEELVTEISKTIDIANVNPGELAGVFIPSGTEIPAGVYNGWKCVVSTTFGIKGAILYSGSFYYTTSSGTNSAAPAAIGDQEPDGDIDLGDFYLNPPGDYAKYEADVSSQLGGDTHTASGAGKNYEVIPGQSCTEELYVDVTNAIALHQVGPAVFQIYPGEPTIDTTDD